MFFLSNLKAVGSLPSFARDDGSASNAMSLKGFLQAKEAEWRETSTAQQQTAAAAEKTFGLERSWLEWQVARQQVQTKKSIYKTYSSIAQTGRDEVSSICENLFFGRAGVTPGKRLLGRPTEGEGAGP